MDRLDQLEPARRRSHRARRAAPTELKADDRVFAGSFNLSCSGEQNAENVLELHDPDLADRLAAFTDGVRERYPGMPAPDLR